MASYALGNLAKAAMEGVYDMATSFTTANASNMHAIVLDPLTTLLRLALLPYNPENTKISVRNATIEFDPPQLQGTVRTLKRSHRESLKELKPAIENAVKLYNVRNFCIEYIFRRAIDGLKCLLHVYNPGNLPNPNNVCNSIELYIQCLENPLLAPVQDKDTEQSESKRSDDTSHMIYNDIQTLSTIPHSDIFTSVWTANLIQSIYLLLIETSQLNSVTPSTHTDSQSLSSIVQAINIILDSKDEMIKTQINHVTTTYKPQ